MQNVEETPVLIVGAAPNAVEDALTYLKTAQDRHGSVLASAHVVVRGDIQQTALPDDVLHDTSGELHQRFCGDGPT